ncbi:hypothetical protein [Gracilibacillus oryzae]|uniref:hypothetical protein n=1 Tax=Gracilibacillus oryzae TaxID=1672701 RepID=UPI00129744C7|nr:hypothetical protein [Gracilibacillus oryzae]
MGITQLTIANHDEVLRLFGSEIDNYHFIINDLTVNHYVGDQFRYLGSMKREY